MLALPDMAFGGPVVQVGPEAGGFRIKDLDGLGPVDQILTHQGMESPAPLALRAEKT